MKKREDDGKAVMEHLILLLHNEWERSGRTRLTVRISADDLEKVKKTVDEYIAALNGRADSESCLFTQSMRMSHEAFILLRLAKKVKNQEEKAAKKGGMEEIRVDLDKEEYKLYKKIAGDLTD